MVDINDDLFNDILTNEIQQHLKKICICKGISQKTIEEAIDEGNLTVSDIQRRTGAGTGSCAGKRCKEKIQRLIEQRQSLKNSHRK